MIAHLFFMYEVMRSKYWGLSQCDVTDSTSVSIWRR